MLQESGVEVVDSGSDQEMGQQASVQLSISIDDELVNKYTEDDVLFIYAQAIGGSPMPLAVYRTEAAALPLQVTLDDSLSMMPTHKISDFEEVKIQARISKSGTAEVSSGDLIGVIENVPVTGTETLDLNIDTIVP
jgi:cytochrome c-type biogenesis protein CcmH